MPSHILKNSPSGFHICGYDSNGIPDFWYFSNVGEMQDYHYLDLRGVYNPPASDFLERDAKEKGWNGSDKNSVPNYVQIYRNGDFRVHVALWEEFDSILANLTKFPDFKIPTTPQQYGEYVKFKFEIIAYLYKKRAQKQIIARPIDVLILQSEEYSS